MSSDVSDVDLDSLYQQILLSEQEVSENSRQLHEVNLSIAKAEEEIKSFTEKLERANTELDEKAQLEAELLLQLKLIKKQEEEIAKKKEDLLQQQTRLRQELERVNRDAAEEKQKFLNAIRTFNNDFNLLNRRELVFKSQTRSEMPTLQSEAEALTEEMGRTEQENSQLMALRSEQQSLNAELQGLHSQLSDLERELEEAEALTESLKTEKQTAAQKPLTDRTCLRLKKDLEAHKELEMLHATLSAEIDHLSSVTVFITHIRNYSRSWRSDEFASVQRLAVGSMFMDNLFCFMVCWRFYETIDTAKVFLRCSLVVHCIISPH